MTVYEMIQRHKAVKKEIRQSGISASQKAHKERQLTMHRVTQELSPVFETLSLVHKSPQPGKHHKAIRTSDDTTAVKSTDSMPNISAGPTSLHVESPVCCKSDVKPPTNDQDNEKINEAMQPSQSPVFTAVQLLEGSKRIRRASRRGQIARSFMTVRPPPTSSQPPAEVPAEQSIEPSAAAAPALSAMQQNLWNKAEQASWESDSI